MNSHYAFLEAKQPPLLKAKQCSWTQHANYAVIHYVFGEVRNETREGLETTLMSEILKGETIWGASC